MLKYPTSSCVTFMRGLISELTDQIQQRHGFTAVGMAVSHKNDNVDIAVSGVRKHKAGVPVQLTDKWHIGSITKSISATLIGKMVEESLLEFGARIPELLPTIPMHPLWKNCTVEHLLTHTSGLPANFSRKVNNVNPTSTKLLLAARGNAIREILAKPPKWPSGSAFLYSNIGYTVVGHIAETRAGSDYESLVRDQIFKPCGFDSAGFGPPRGDSLNDQPVGHHAALWYRKAVDPFDAKADNGPVISAAGRAHMNLEDLVAYGRAHLDGELGADRFLRASTWQKLHRPVMNDSGYGWVNTTQDWAGGQVIWHNGSNTMWYALLMLLPEKNAVLAFVTNNGMIRKADKAFIQAAERISGQLG